jgi:lipopolysaccharide biosynthesis regulator YciM|tara:strand:+ start:629 stop:1810 length:1182 start_codon:yes stop_codon:yes gene_type:complete
MENWLLYVLILVAIAIGWWWGRRERKSQVSNDHQKLSRNYFQGLNYLLNEQPDRAISTFIQALEVNSDTIETHLALGSLLRRRGEVDKAVSVHQNLLARPQLNRETSHYVQLELARDYFLAGLLDRAEKLLLDLIEESGDAREPGLQLLVEIYQQERDWQKAIDVASKLPSKGSDGNTVRRSLAHLHCELCQVALDEGDYRLAKEQIVSAFGHDNNCVRASLLMGRLEYQLDHMKDAIKALKKIRVQNGTFVPESLDLLSRCYQQDGGNQKGLRDYLHQCLDETPAISIVLALAKSIREDQGDEAMARFISDHLKKNPTIRGLTQLIDLHIDNAHGIARENLAILRSFTEALVADKPVYRCEECGFSGKKLHWLCPSCKRWGSVIPIYGLEGE